MSDLTYIAMFGAVALCVMLALIGIVVGSAD